MTIRRVAGLGLCVALVALAVPSVASAHAFELGREDVPIPVSVFIGGAAGVLVLSFIALSVLWRRTQFEDERWRPLPEGVSRVVTSRTTEIVAGAIGVGLLGVVVWTGLDGVDVPTVNFSETFVWISFWLGGVFGSVLLGNVYRALNPWRAIARVASFAVARVRRHEASPPFRYPEWLGRWPAAVGLIVFVWMELISGVNGPGVTPHATAIATLIYTAYTFCGMALFGIETWVSRADTFSVYFAMFSELSVFEMRGKRLGIRRPLSGAPRWAKVPGSIAMVIATLGGTVFDGAHEGALVKPIASVYDRFVRLGLSIGAAARIVDTLFLVGVIAAVAVIFWIGVRGMETVEGSPPLSQLGIRFVHSLIPIGLAYLIAHYFSYFFWGMQGQFSYLLTDPLGHHSAGQISLTPLSSNLIWWVQVGALVIGHVTGLVLAHDKALATYGEARRASLSQRWMLVVMVAFTCLGLWLVSQINA